MEKVHKENTELYLQDFISLNKKFEKRRVILYYISIQIFLESVYLFYGFLCVVHGKILYFH